MTILLTVLLVLAVLDLAAAARWVRADSDGRPPRPAAEAYETFGKVAR